MKSSKIKLTALVVLVLAGVVLYKMNSQSEVTEHGSETSVSSQTAQIDTLDDDGEAHSHVHGNLSHPDVKAAPVKAMDSREREEFIEKSLAAVSPNERESLLGLSSIMSKFTLDEGHGQIKELINELKNKQMKPYLMQDTNPDTGTMNVVRTKSTLPGTRYFHAQVFKDDQGRDFIQHVSFEFKPGPNSFDAVKAALIKEAGITSAPVIEKDGFVAWSVGPYSVWAKVQTEEDFKDDPINAHDKNDVGTIRAAFELEIHDAEAPIEHAPADSVAP